MAADIILHHAKIATSSVPAFVEAVAIEGNKILATGTDDEILRHRGSATCDSPGLSDTGGSQIMVPDGGPKDEPIEG